MGRKKMMTAEDEKQLRIRALIAARQMGYTSLRAFLIEQMQKLIEKSKKPIAGLK